MKANGKKVANWAVLVVIDTAQEMGKFQSVDLQRKFHQAGVGRSNLQAAAGNLIRRMKRADLITLGRDKRTWFCN